LIGRPEQKRHSQHDCFEKFPDGRPVRDLVNEIGDGDHGQRKGSENIMRAGGKPAGKSVPHQQLNAAYKGDDAADYSENSMGPIQTAVHDPVYRKQRLCKKATERFEDFRYGLRIRDRNGEIKSAVFAGAGLVLVGGLVMTFYRG
jgi:hypothetical protein